MTDGAALLAAIIAQPDEDGPRLACVILSGEYREPRRAMFAPNTDITVEYYVEAVEATDAEKEIMALADRADVLSQQFPGGPFVPPVEIGVAVSDMENIVANARALATAGVTTAEIVQALRPPR